MSDLWIRGMFGLGDNIFQRIFIRAAAKRHKLYLTTPWPEIYSDLPVYPVREMTGLRTQAANIARNPDGVWAKPPRGIRHIQVSYNSRTLEQLGIVRALESLLPLGDHPFVCDLPRAISSGPSMPKRPYAIVRPVTLRKEWMSRARGPDPQYIQMAINLLKARDIAVVTLADVDGKAEWFEGEPPVGMDLAFHRGEIKPPYLFEVIRNAACAVGGVGWIVPMAIATGTRLFCIFGGRGGHNAPVKISDPRMDLSKTTWMLPDKFCMCIAAEHRCNKTISDFKEKFDAWLDAEGIGLERIRRHRLLPRGPTGLAV